MVSALPVRDIFLQQDNQAVAITYLIVRYNIIPPRSEKTVQQQVLIVLISAGCGPVSLRLFHQPHFPFGNRLPFCPIGQGFQFLCPWFICTYIIR